MRVIILGTGTDVGKTYVTACLARGLRKHGPVTALKPIESGVTVDVAGDAGVIANAAGHAPALSPWRFPRPVSPHLGAREARSPIAIATVVAWVREQEHVLGAPVSLVELAGGAFSPLGVGLTNVDLALALEPSLWLLVAPDALGVLHDITATLRALPRPPDAVVLSAARTPDESTGSNARELAALAITPVLDVVVSGADSCTSAVQWLLGLATLKSRH